MSIEMKLKVSEIQRFCMHDGPGLRTTVFFKGCPLRCAWCHNPETQKKSTELLFYKSKCIDCASCAAVCPARAHTFDGDHGIDREKCTVCLACTQVCPTGALELCGKEMTVEEILSLVERDRAFYGNKGGITLSGGEPFMQGEGIIALLKVCKERGLSVAVETCGFGERELFERALPFVDLFLWDVKDTDEARHRRYTGASTDQILGNLAAVNRAGAKIRLRAILVNGVNTDKAHYEALADLALGIRNLDGVELIPYHAYGGTKSVFLGQNDNGNAEWIPHAEQLREAKAILAARGVKIFDNQ